jgi:hypothetical protein
MNEGFTEPEITSLRKTSPSISVVEVRLMEMADFDGPRARKDTAEKFVRPRRGGGTESQPYVTQCSI